VNAQERRDWIGFCENATDSQLQAIIEKESASTDPYREECADLARMVQRNRNQ